MVKKGWSKEQVLKMIQDAARQTLAMEDIKSVYLGMPQRANTVTESKYKPSLGSSDKKYYKTSYMRIPKTINNVLIPASNNIKLKNIIEDNGNDTPLGSVISIGSSGKNGVAMLPLFGRATVGIGIDPSKGEYISYLDNWDVQMNGSSNGNDWVQYILGGIPPTFYDRIYLDDYYGINSQPEKGVYYGGYLPEIKIKKQKGGAHTNFSNGGNLTAH